MGPKTCCVVLPFNPERGSAPREYTLAGVRADSMILFLGRGGTCEKQGLCPRPPIPSQHSVALSTAHT